MDFHLSADRASHISSTAGVAPVLERLPPLAYFVVSQFLGDADVLTLQRTCESLYSALEDRAIWSHRISQSSVVRAALARESAEPANLRIFYFRVHSVVERGAALRHLREVCALLSLGVAAQEPVSVPPPPPPPPTSSSPNSPRLSPSTPRGAVPSPSDGGSMSESGDASPRLTASRSPVVRLALAYGDVGAALSVSPAGLRVVAALERAADARRDSDDGGRASPPPTAASRRRDRFSVGGGSEDRSSGVGGNSMGGSAGSGGAGGSVARRSRFLSVSESEAGGSAGARTVGVINQMLRALATTPRAMCATADSEFSVAEEVAQHLENALSSTTTVTPHLTARNSAETLTVIATARSQGSARRTALDFTESPVRATMEIQCAAASDAIKTGDLCATAADCFSAPVPLRSASRLLVARLDWLHRARSSFGVRTVRGAVIGGSPLVAAQTGLREGEARAVAVDGARVAFADRAGAVRLYSSASERIAAFRSVALGSGSDGGGATRSGGGGSGGGGLHCCPSVCSMSLAGDVLATGHSDGSVTVTNLEDGAAFFQTSLRLPLGDDAGPRAATDGSSPPQPRSRRGDAGAAHTSVALLSGGSHALVGYVKKTWHGAFEKDSRLALFSIETGGVVTRFSPAAGSRATGKTLVDDVSSPTAVRAAVGSSGVLAAVGYQQGKLTVWDMRARREAFSLNVPAHEEDAACSVTQLAFHGHTIVDARASADGPPNPFAPRSHLLPVASPYVRVWDVRATREPTRRLDLGGHAIRNVTGVALNGGAVLVAHGHVYRPTLISRMLLSSTAAGERVENNAVAAIASGAGAAPAVAAPAGEGDRLDMGERARENVAEGLKLFSLSQFMTLGSASKLGALEKSSIDPAVVPEYAWRRGHAPFAWPAWPPRRGHAHALVRGGGCTEECTTSYAADFGVESLPLDAEMWGISSWDALTFSHCSWLPLSSAACLAASNRSIAIGCDDSIAIYGTGADN